jgi:hypothetical protein
MLCGLIKSILRSTLGGCCRRRYFYALIFFRLPLETCFREEISRVLLEPCLHGLPDLISHPHFGGEKGLFTAPTKISQVKAQKGDMPERTPFRCLLSPRPILLRSLLGTRGGRNEEVACTQGGSNSGFEMAAALEKWSGSRRRWPPRLPCLRPRQAHGVRPLDPTVLQASGVVDAALRELVCLDGCCVHAPSHHHRLHGPSKHRHLHGCCFGWIGLEGGGGDGNGAQDVAGL